MKYQVLEQISPSISLYYRGQSKHTSPFSITISILSYMTLATISIIFFYLFLQHNFVSAFYYNRYIADTGIFYLNESNLFHVVAFTDEYDERAISVIGIKDMIGTTSLENLNQSEVDHWIYEKCDKSHYSAQTQSMIDSVHSAKNVILCVSKYYNSKTKSILNYDDDGFEYPTLEHGVSTRAHIFYGIAIMKCQDNEYNNFTCETDEKKDKFKNDGYTYSVYKKPYTSGMAEVSSTFSSSSITTNNLNFIPLNIKTRKGLMFDTIEDIFSYKYSVNEKLTYESTHSNIYSTAYFWMLNREDVYE